MKYLYSPKPSLLITNMSSFVNPYGKNPDGSLRQRPTPIFDTNCITIVPMDKWIQNTFPPPPNTSPTPHIDRNDPLIQEAEEILKIRKELLEKQRLEQEEKEQRKQKAMDLLTIKSEILNRYIHPHPPGSYNYASLPHPSHGWAQREENIELILKADTEIQEYHKSCLPEVELAVKTCMDQLWASRTDQAILQWKDSGWFEYPQYTIYSALKYDVDYPDWKALVRREIGLPIFNLQYNQLEFYCKKFIERS